MSTPIKTQWFSLPAAASCFELAKTKCDRWWSPANEAQAEFLASYYPTWEEGLKALVRPSELETKMKIDTAGMSLFAAITACSQWQSPGKEVSTFPESDGFVQVEYAVEPDTGLQYQPDPRGKHLILFETFTASRYKAFPYPVFSMPTKDSDFREEVHVTPYFPGEHMDPSDDHPFALWKFIQEAQLEGHLFEYDRLYIPKIALDLTQSLQWPLGLEMLPSEETEVTQVVVEAKQRLELKVNHEGFYERNEFQMFTLAAASGDEDFEEEKYFAINGPMLYWRTRNKKLSFCAVIGIQDYGDPGEIEF